MSTNLATKTCAWGIVVLMSTGPAWAQDGHGSIVGWGSWVVAGDLSTDFVGVAAGYRHSLGLKADGSIAAWGRNHYGECDVPGPTCATALL